MSKCILAEVKNETVQSSKKRVYYKGKKNKPVSIYIIECQSNNNRPKRFWKETILSQEFHTVSNFPLCVKK